MTDTGTGRHYAKVIESGLPPAQELIALTIALHLNLHILAIGRIDSKLVDHDRVIDDQIHRVGRVDERRILASSGYGIAHRRQIHYSGHAGEVLH